MNYLIKTVPQHVWNPDGTKLTGEIASAQERRSYLHQLEIPHFLNSDPRLGKVTAGHASMIIPSDMAIQPGDLLENEYGWKAMVTHVLNDRPARGDWQRRAARFVEVRYI